MRIIEKYQGNKMSFSNRLLVYLVNTFLLLSVFPITFAEASDTNYSFSSIITTVDYAYGSDTKKLIGPESYNISKADFEDKDNLLVFSYDAYIPDSNDTKQTIYSYLQFDGIKENSKQFALGAKLGFSSGKRNFYGFDYDNATIDKSDKQYLTQYGYNARTLFCNATDDASGGQWVNLKTIVKYDKLKKAYVSWNYINGKALLVADKQSAVLTFKANDSWIDNAANRSGIKYVIGVRCGNTGTSGKDIKIANICLNLYSTTEFKNTIEIANGVSDIDIYASNAKFIDKPNVSSSVKAGLIDVSDAEITATKNGKKVHDVTVQNIPVLHDNNITVSDGSSFRICGLPTLAKGDILKVLMDGAITADGTAASNIELTFFGKWTEQTVIYNFDDSALDIKNKIIKLNVGVEKLFAAEEAHGSAKAICAGYNDYGILKCISINEMKYSDIDFIDKRYNYTANIDYADDVSEVKLFLFDDVTNIVPLTVSQFLSAESSIAEYDVRSEKIKAYMNDSYDSVKKYCDATLELDRPQKITFKLSLDNAPKSTAGYILKISENPDMSEPWIFESVSEYADICNFKTGTNYYWTAESMDTGDKSEVYQFFTTHGAPRTIYAKGVKNLRDIGGWTTENGCVIRQGIAYRSYRLSDESGNSAVTQQGMQVLNDQLHIGMEIDFRENSETTTSKSVLGDNVRYLRIPLNYQKDYLVGNKAAIKQIMELFADENNYPVIFHCSAGADRTGMISYLLNGLCGVEKEQLLRDYFLTNFSMQSIYRDFDKISDKYVKTLDNYLGDKLSKKIYNYLNMEVGVSEDTLDRIINNLTEHGQTADY